MSESITIEQAAAILDVPVEMALRAKELQRLSPALSDRVWRGEIDLDAAFDQLDGNATRSKALDAFNATLTKMPRPGRGENCHTYLMTCANAAKRAGMALEDAVKRIYAAVPGGGRQVDEREVRDAVERAYSTEAAPVKQVSPAVNADTFWRGVLSRTAGMTVNDLEAELFSRSCIRLNDEPAGDAVLLLESIYHPSDALFIGTQYDTGVKPVESWVKLLKSGATVPPHVIPNVLTGKPAPDKAGKGTTLRGDNSVLGFNIAVAEMDGRPRAEQLAFWMTVDLPVIALIDSAGKSIHGWVATPGISTTEQWDDQVEVELFGKWLIPLGCDPACKNEARLSRLPGHFRQETKQWQRLLYLAPGGRRVLS
jgi:hypothetical protein